MLCEEKSRLDGFTPYGSEAFGFTGTFTLFTTRAGG
jgi:hypothetical protein